MDVEELEAYIRLGEAHSSVLNAFKKKIKAGTRVIDIISDSENLIRELGYRLAFPTNLSINDVAAHYTSPPEDSSVIPEIGIVKIDMGSHLNGLIVDAARSIALDEKLEEMVEVARDALDKAVESMWPGKRIRDVSEAIYSTIVAAGYKPIQNLTGHKIEKFRLHAGVDIPNIPVRGYYKIKEGDVFAIEPFVTLPEARGTVAPIGDPLIFSYKRKVRTRDEMERRVIKLVEKKYSKLPFCERWLVSDIGHRVNHALLRLIRRGSLRDYPPLMEMSNKVVAQYEDTVLVTSDGPVRLTYEK